MTDMDNGTLIGIIGLVATFVFGFLSIDLFKRRRYPGRITYVKLSLIDLLNNVANNFDEIQLLHENQPIKKNIIYLKGALLNNGDIDINSKTTEKDITLGLPDGCRWLDIKPTASSEGLTTAITINDDSRASFKFDLFRKDEFVQFEGLIESDKQDVSSDEIDLQLQFTHRIENTGGIEKKVLLSDKEIKRKKKSAIWYSVLLLGLLLFIAVTFTFNLFDSSTEKVYFKEKGSNRADLYEIRLEKKDSTIKVEPVEGDVEEKSLSVAEFNKMYEATSGKLTFWQKLKDQYWIISLQLGFFIIIVLSELFEINKARKLRKILFK